MSQCALILAYLIAHGRTSCAELERALDIRSVTTRISELVRRGVPIRKTVESLPLPSGRIRRVTFYEIDPATGQGDLFA